MIVAIMGAQDPALRLQLAASLAVLRARSGRSICIINADPHSRVYGWGCQRGYAGQGPSVPVRKLGRQALPEEIDSLSGTCTDLVIHTGERDTPEARSALGAARLAVVPIQSGQASLESQYALIARLNFARMINPGLRVLFVLVTGGGAPTDLELASVRSYVAHVMSASLASTILLDPGSREYGPGRCVADAETCDPELAAGLQALYREIYLH